MSGFSIDSKGLFEGLDLLETKAERASTLFAKSAANEMVAEAKQHATWADRTGLSRNTIDSKIQTEIGKTDILLRGNTPHFKYLELCHEKRNAILWPTVKRNMARVVRAWARVVWR